MMGPGRIVLLAGCLLSSLSGSVQADIYGFVDDQGTPHFSNVPQDRRYVLFMRTAPEPRALVTANVAPERLKVRQRAYSAQVAKVAGSLRLDAALLHAVITAESGYNPRARSGKGAMGLMQLMPETARRYCVQDPYDAAQNLRGGSRYLRDLLRRYDNNPRLALAAYNAGEEAVARHGNQIPPYRETRLYVPLVMRLYELYRNNPELGRVASVADADGRSLEGGCG